MGMPLPLRVALLGAASFAAGGAPFVLASALDFEPPHPVVLVVLVGLPFLVGGAGIAAALGASRARRLAMLGAAAGLVLLPLGYVIGAAIDFALQPHRFLGHTARTALQGLLWLAPGGALYGAALAWILARKRAVATFALAGAAGFGFAGAVLVPAIVPLYRIGSRATESDDAAVALVVLVICLVLGLSAGGALGLAAGKRAD